MDFRLSTVADAEQLSQYYLMNTEHLIHWEPLRESGYHDASNWAERLVQRDLEQQEGRSAYFVACRSGTDDIIAICNLTGIVHGVFQAGYMGYSIAKDYQGQGKMKKLCRYVIDFAFSDLKLNRIMANYMPNNMRSEILLKSLGFEVEGTAKSYLKINGQWEDHILTSLLNTYGISQISNK